MAISTLSSGFGAAIRSFLISVIPKNQTTVLYSLFSASGAAGGLTGNPFLQYFLSIGIRVGDWMTGLPFYVASFLHIICGTAIWSIQFLGYMTPEED